MNASISGIRVLLRELRTEDLGTYLDWQCSETVGKRLSWLPRTREEATKSFEDAIREQKNPDRQRYFMAIARQGDGEIVGSVGISKLSPTEADMGWFLRPGFEGNGYAVEGARLMLDLCSKIEKLELLRASCRRENVKSENIMKKLDFRLEKETPERVWYVFDLNRNNAR